MTVTRQPWRSGCRVAVEEVALAPLTTVGQLSMIDQLIQLSRSLAEDHQCSIISTGDALTSVHTWLTQSYWCSEGKNPEFLGFFSRQNTDDFALSLCLSGLTKSECWCHRLLKETRVQRLQCPIRTWTLHSPMVPIILVSTFKAPKKIHSPKNDDFLS